MELFQKMNWHKIIGVFFGIFTASSHSFPNVSLEKVGEYIAASDVNEKFNTSKCSKFFEKKNSTTLNSAISKIRRHINTTDRIEFEEYLKSNDFRRQLIEHSEFINKFIEISNSKGMELSLVCKELHYIITTKNDKIFEFWGKLKQ